MSRGLGQHGLSSINLISSPPFHLPAYHHHRYMWLPPPSKHLGQKTAEKDMASTSVMEADRVIFPDFRKPLKGFLLQILNHEKVLELPFLTPLVNRRERTFFFFY